MKKMLLLITHHSVILKYFFLHTALLICMASCTAHQDNAKGNLLVFRRIANPNDGSFEMLLSSDDVDISQFLSLGYYRGVPALSRNGDYLAVGCLDYYDKICILDIQNIEEKIGTAEQYIPPIIRILEPPKSCRALLSDAGVESLSWSYDDEKLAVVCSRDFHSESRETCIVPVSNSEQSTCWDLPIPYFISRVEWSPVNDQLVISSTGGYGSKIYVIDQYGREPVFLTEGWGASWSPDGKKIAFMQWQDEYYTWENGRVILDPKIKVTYAGLATVNSDGTDLRWIYRNPGTESIDKLRISFGCSGMAAVCNTTWSPDGKYIAFSGNSGGMYSFYVFTINLETGEIEYVTSPNQELRFNSAPDWAK